MKSGLEDRNNVSAAVKTLRDEKVLVSMKSGLEDRNNVSAAVKTLRDEKVLVSMKSGLEDRNNWGFRRTATVC